MARNPTPKTPAAPIKRNRTLLITKNGTPINHSPRTIHHHLNKAFPKAITAEVWITPKRDVQLIAVTTTTSDRLLK